MRSGRGHRRRIFAQAAEDRFLASAEIIAAGGADHAYVILGDSDHDDEVINEFLYDPRWPEILAQEGFRHIAIEFPISFQPLFDQFSKGEISERDFQTVMECIECGRVAGEYEALKSEFLNRTSSASFTQYIKAAADHNISVHTVDALEGVGGIELDLRRQSVRYVEFARFLKENPLIYTDRDAFLRDYPEIIDPVLSTAFEGDHENMEEFEFLAALYVKWRYDFNAYKGWDDPKETSAFHEDMNIEWRLQRDDMLAARIRYKTRGEKTLVIYGAGHAMHKGPNLSKELHDAPVYVAINGDLGMKGFAMTSLMFATSRDLPANENFFLVDFIAGQKTRWVRGISNFSSAANFSI